jgi:CubicO group peptidase (beta-lactamase class C family)
VTPVEAFLGEEIAEGSFPGAVALVGSGERLLEIAAAGHACLEPDEVAVSRDTLFDLASLTKPLCSGALAAVAGDALSLDAPPGRYLPEWKQTRFDGIRVEHLLTHTSGLASWYPLYTRGEGAAAYRKTLAAMEPQARPGGQVLYSDLNFLVLGEILETIFTARLDRLFSDLVAGPAGSRAGFLPPAGAETAATEKGDRFERAMTESRGLTYAHFRDGVVRGEVHDGNAFRRGGVAAHAGLFATAADVYALARTWLEPARADSGLDRTPELSEARGLAWQGWRGAGSAIPEMSPRAFGHTGFTGTSLWIDPEHELVSVLLTNRIHPEVREIPFNEVRQRFHAAVYAAYA